MLRRGHLATASGIVTMALAACALSPEQKLALEKHRSSIVAEMEQRVSAEMSEVLPLVKPAHLKECAERMKSPTLFGTTFKIVGNPSPSVTLSCFYQPKDMIDTALAITNTKRAAFMVPITRDGDERNSVRTASHCVFAAREGQIVSVTAHRELKFKANDPCRILLAKSA